MPYWSAAWAALPGALPAFDASQLKSPLGIAYERYSAALIQRGGPEAQLTFAVMALEALLLGQEERTDLKFRLALRCAKLLSKLSYDGPKTQRDVREAYDIRSVYVHGAVLSAKERSRIERRCGKTVEALCMGILDLARVVMLAYIFGGINKDDLLPLLDESLLQGERESELEKKLRPAIPICSSKQ